LRFTLLVITSTKHIVSNNISKDPHHAIFIYELFGTIDSKPLFPLRKCPSSHHHGGSFQNELSVQSPSLISKIDTTLPCIILSFPIQLLYHVVVICYGMLICHTPVHYFNDLLNLIDAFQTFSREITLLRFRIHQRCDSTALNRFT